jgi:hypothetical protein
MNPVKPRKPRRLRAPIEPGLANEEEDDPRSAAWRARRRHERNGSARGEIAREEAPQCEPRAARDPDAPPRYAELHCLSNFSFQRGASSAIELFERAKVLGYSALAITDECSLAGIVRALEASKKTKLKLIVGTEVQLADGPKLVLLAKDQGRVFRHLPPDHHRPPLQRKRRILPDACRRRTARQRRARLWIPALCAVHPEPAHSQVHEQARWITRHSMVAHGLRSSFIAVPTMRQGWPGFVRSARCTGCRWSLRAMCTCICASAGRCTT